ncbi:PREDICTED: pre-mRNA 3'-end-processing factor FIP1-like [Gekko japonicus]|uniref:Pre-mRNA 3'-end-processing factor FIP1-like n=1 Tax=Gekko japonicus TaxID=146911 RepID=A0ABM1L2Y7_GEKJA|nr:PREDICTED: pre-mRNA 3'-end-processing factor FIP1-like [Gekko japonicus]
MGWMMNKLKINPGQTEVLGVSGTADQGLQVSPALDGVKIPFRIEGHSLGVPLDTAVTLDNQVAAVVRNVFAQLQLVHQLHLFLGADLSDYFNYGFNEETWKAYCEKQRRLQLGLEPSAPVSTENKITVQQGRTGNAEKEPENNIVKMDFKTDFVALVGGRIKAGPPPNRKLGGTIDVIGGQAGTIRRVEGRRRDKHASEENPIQVLGDHGSKSQPLQQPQQPSQPQQPPQQQPFAPPTGPPLGGPPPIGGPPPPHFLHPPPPPPVTAVPPPLHPPGLPPPGPIPGLFPPPLAPPPALLIPTLDGQPASFSNRQPPPFGYSSTDSGFISYPPISTSHAPWVTTVDKASSASDGGHWEYSVSDRGGMSTLKGWYPEDQRAA